MFCQKKEDNSTYSVKKKKLTRGYQASNEEKKGEELSDMKIMLHKIRWKERHPREC